MKRGQSPESDVSADSVTLVPSPSTPLNLSAPEVFTVTVPLPLFWGLSGFPSFAPGICKVYVPAKGAGLPRGLKLLRFATKAADHELLVTVPEMELLSVVFACTDTTRPTVFFCEIVEVPAPEELNFPWNEEVFAANCSLPE